MHDLIICIYLLQTHSFSLLKMNWYHVDYGIQLQFWSHPFPAEKDEEAHLYILDGLSNIFSKFSFWVNYSLLQDLQHIQNRLTIYRIAYAV